MASAAVTANVDVVRGIARMVGPAAYRLVGLFVTPSREKPTSAPPSDRFVAQTRPW